MIHALISSIFCTGCIVFGLPFWLCLLPAVFYIGREFTQAEYRYITQYCNGKRANMPWYGGFLFKAWDTKGMLDWMLPLWVSILIMILAY
jgi:hypothetical protein